jgi:hypothetical protein
MELSWTEVNDLNTARRSAGAGGTSTSGILVELLVIQELQLHRILEWNFLD